MKKLGIIIATLIGLWCAKNAFGHSNSPGAYSMTEAYRTDYHHDINWLGKITYFRADGVLVTDDYEIGLRDDGVVVWRQK